MSRTRSFYLMCCRALLCLMLLSGCGYRAPVTMLAQGTTITPGDQNTEPPTTIPFSVTPSPRLTDLPVTTIGTPSVGTQDPSATSTPSSIQSISTRYELNATFDYYRHWLSVTEAIHYTNPTPDVLTDLILIIEPNQWQGGFSLKSLAWQNGEDIAQYELLEDHLHIDLPQSLAPGEEISLGISYQLLFPEIPPPSGIERPQPFGYTERQTNIVDWYPYIPPYKPDVGWLLHKPGWFGEHQVFDVAEFDVQLALAEPVKDFVLAASAPAEQDGDVYTYHLAAGRTFALSASDEYLVQSTVAGGVTIYSYSFPYDKYASQEAMHNTSTALELFSQLIMPYPHTSLSVVEADFLDGMEYDGLYFLSHGFYDLYDGTPKGYLTFIAAHETAHQWWYGLVGNDQALEPWLDEALCTYMERVFYENIYAERPLENGQSLVDWWWYYRVNFYDPTGPVNGTIYDFDDFYSYRNAVYLNGAKFLDALRALVGDQDFFTFLREYARQNRYKLSTSTDFFSILQENTDKDFSSLVAEYFQLAK